MTRWTGRSGRVYALEPDGGAREGGMATVRRVRAVGPPVGTSLAAEGSVLALKSARHEDPLAVEALRREVDSFVALSRAPGSPPCPRLHDVVGDPADALVMDWCPTDLERWWEGHWSAPRAFVDLCEAMADTCRRVREYAAVSELELGRRVIHADIKPRNVLRTEDGRWLLTDFGAAKARPVEDIAWAATRMILGTENFIAPEALFNARKPFPAAMDTWSIACSFFALLRMRTLLKDGGRMPINGTHAHHFRTQRVALVTDLQQRKPEIFSDRALDPAQFSRPDALPEKDRLAVIAALDGIFGAPAPAVEALLAEDACTLLDRALRIEPARRFTDPLELAAEFEALAQRYRELAVRTAPAPVEPAAVAAPAVAQGLPVTEAPVVASTPGALRGAGSPPPQDDPRDDDPEEDAGDDEMAQRTAVIPVWLKVTLAALGLGQVVTLGVAGAALALVLNPVPAPAAAPPADVVSAPPPVPAASTAPAAPIEPIATTEPVAAIEAPTAAAAPVRAATATAAQPARPADPSRAEEPAPAATPSRPPSPAAASNSDAGASGLVLVTGAQAYLVGPNGRQPVGSVPAGSYELFAQIRSDGEFQSLGTIAVGNGDRVVWRCGLGACKPAQ